MKMKLLSVLGLCLEFNQAQAINVGTITTIINSNESSVTKEISNPAENSRLVALRIQRVNSPMSDGQDIPFDQPDEVLASPANIVLTAQGADIFRIKYNGPADDNERYYRLTWADMPVMEKVAINEQAKTAIVNTRISISTILVVAPRQEKFSYDFKDGVISNTGNVSFRVTSAGGCEATQQCNLDTYLLPGKERKIDYATNDKAFVGIWHNKNFIPVKNSTNTK